VAVAVDPLGVIATPAAGTHALQLVRPAGA